MAPACPSVPRSAVPQEGGGDPGGDPAPPRSPRPGSPRRLSASRRQREPGAAARRRSARAGVRPASAFSSSSAAAALPGGDSAAGTLAVPRGRLYLSSETRLPGSLGSGPAPLAPDEGGGRRGEGGGKRGEGRGRTKVEAAMSCARLGLVSWESQAGETAAGVRGAGRPGRRRSHSGCARR